MAHWGDSHPASRWRSTTISDAGRAWSLQAQPRAWQSIALEKWKAEQRGIVRVVTGGGKTIFAHMCTLIFLERAPSGQVVILVPTLALLDQWYVSLREDLAVPERDIACFSGEEKADAPRRLNLLVLNTARDLAPQIAARTRTLLIVDECHRIGTPANSTALRATYAATLGLSATPEREYDEGFDDLIAPSLGPVIHTYDYVTARSDGVISPFRLVNIRVDLYPDEQAEYDALTKRIGREVSQITDIKHPTERLRRLLQARAIVSANARMRNPVAAKVADMSRGKRTLIFLERIDRAEALATVLHARGHGVTQYHTGVGPILRRDNLRLYRTGVFDVLVTCRALDEGLNVPETEVAVIASSTASIRQRVQRLGRVLRPARGKEMATIYTIYATDSEEKRLAREAKSFKDVASVAWQHGALRADG